MRIECLTTFMDGADRFESGDIRTVEGERGMRLVGNGWAKDMSGDIPTGGSGATQTNLTIDSGRLYSGDNHG